MAPDDEGHTRAGILRDLTRLGLRTGQTVLVTASLRSVGWVAGGPATVAGALRAAVAPGGTVVTPTTTEANSDTSRAHLAGIAGLTRDEVRAFRDRMSPYSRVHSPAENGRIAEAVRTMPGAIRSDHPQSSFAAVGPLARALMRDHRMDCHLGEQSPLGAMYRAGAWVLLLGVGYGSCTAMHLAEYRYRPDPPRRAYRCVVKSYGDTRWCEYEDVVLDDSDFLAIGEQLDASAHVIRGYVGYAECRLMPMRFLVDSATKWMRENRL